MTALAVRLNHAVLYVSDLETSVTSRRQLPRAQHRFLSAALAMRVLGSEPPRTLTCNRFEPTSACQDVLMKSDDEVALAFGEFIRAQRRLANISQRQLGR